MCMPSSFQSSTILNLARRRNLSQVLVTNLSSPVLVSFRNLPGKSVEPSTNDFWARHVRQLQTNLMIIIYRKGCDFSLFFFFELVSTRWWIDWAYRAYFTILEHWIPFHYFGTTFWKRIFLGIARNLWLCLLRIFSRRRERELLSLLLTPITLEGRSLTWVQLLNGFRRLNFKRMQK